MEEKQRIMEKNVFEKTGTLYPWLMYMLSNKKRETHPKIGFE